MTKQNLHTIVGILFVISGALGLVYQIVWFKYLSLFLGNTTYAQTIVLATFMGGLAIGAALWGRKSDQLSRPLSLYAWLEIGIGLYCLLYPYLLNLLENIFIQLVQSFQLASDSSSVLALKLLVSLISLLLPTILMGGTLPVLVRFMSERIEESGRDIAILYFLNSIGAVGGSLLAGFFLIRLLGLQATMYSAGIANLIIGGIALALVRHTNDNKAVTGRDIEASQLVLPNRKLLIALTTAAVSGFAAMMYEVAWVRLLIPVLGSSIYSFSVMLVSFISGITIGSLIVSAIIQRVKDLFKLLAFCQLGIVVSMIAALPLYARVPFYFWHVATVLNRTDAAYPIFLGIQFVFAFLIMIVPTIFLGMTLPVASRIAARSVKILGRSVGNVFSVNTVGTVLGSLAAGLILIPLVGVRHTIEVGVGLNLMMGLLVLFSAATVTRVRKITYSTVVVLAAAVYLAFGGTWSRWLSLSGVFRLIAENVPPPERYEDFRSANAAKKVFYYKEGTTATVAVYEGEFQQRKQNVLLINGKADASSMGDLPTQVLLGQLPLLFRPQAQSALVVGLGSGVSAGSVLMHPVKQVDCVEISSEVVEASQYFNDVNNRPLDDPRLRLYVEDALAFLKLTPNTYDVMVSEPSNPWIAGIGNLFTREFFEECKKKLNPNGIIVQWFHLYEMDDELIKLVLRTFQAVFPSVTIWQAQSTDIMIVGCNGVLSFDYDELEKTIRMPRVKEDLDRVMIPNVATLLSLQILSEEKAKEFMGVGDLNTEDMPRLEYNAPRVFFVNRVARELLRFDERISFGSPRIFLAKRLQIKPFTEEEMFGIGMLHTTSVRGNLQFGYTILSQFVALEPNNVDALLNLANAAETMRRFDEHILLRRRLMELRSHDPDALERYVWAKYSHERARANMVVGFETQEFEQLLTNSIKLVADTVDRYRIRLADIYFGTSQYAKAGDNYRRALQIREHYEPDFRIHQDILLLQLARCLHNTGQTSNALGYALQATQINPTNEDAKDFIYAIWMNGSSRSNDSVKAKL